ncbi:MAG: nitroreductase family protein [Verrucomicrobia bacterium]|jgi:nitroreductase|nr:nitroreductase family protein [Verrucomicrobiota bacterium]
MRDFFQTVQARQSVRAYQSKPVTAEQLEAILSAANRAPSAGNLQAYGIVIVRDAATIRQLARACFNQDFIAAAPVVLVFCADPARSAAKYGPLGESLYSVQDATVATAYAELAAAALGLSACWVGAFVDKNIAALLRLRAGLRPIALLPIGWPAEQPPRTPRRALDDLAREHLPD